jgi:hypothetical protein
LADGFVQDEMVEFSHVHFGDRGIGQRTSPVLSIVIGQPGLSSYTLPAVRLRAIPSIEQLKAFQRIEDFERVFGEFRGMTDAWGGGGEIHSGLYWTGFTTQRDGSLRVVSVFLHTLISADPVRIEGAHFCEGVVTPTGKPPQPERTSQR